MAYAILRTTKHSTFGTISGMTKHNKREIDVPNHDPSRQNENYEIIGTGNYSFDVNKRIIESKALCQNNSVKTIEHLMTASPDYFKNKEGDEDIIAIHEFIEKSVQWLQNRYGHENVVSVSLHMDETTPHLHAFVVPVVPGKLKSGEIVNRLSAKSYLGGRLAMTEMQDSFAESVKYLGLDRGIKGSKAKHTRVKEFYSHINRAEDFSKSLTPPVIEIDKPPLINREEWQLKQNQLIQKQINEHMKIVQRMVDGKAFKSVSEVLKEKNRQSLQKTIESLKSSLSKLQMEYNILKEGVNTASERERAKVNKEWHIRLDNAGFMVTKDGSIQLKQNNQNQGFLRS